MSKRTILLAIFILLFINAHAQELPKVKFETRLGSVMVEVDTLNAPITAHNFLEHIKKGTYKNAVFYRVVRLDNQPQNDIKIEVIQGGIFTKIRFEKIPSIPHETTQKTGLKHLNGTLSMARMEPGSASTEFFICIGAQPELDYGGKRNPDGQGFAAFGKVVEGMEVVKEIQHQKDIKQTLVEPVKILELSLVN